MSRLHFLYSEDDSFRRIEAWIGDVDNRKDCPYSPDCHGRIIDAHGNAQLVGYIRWRIKSPDYYSGTMTKRGMVAYVFVHRSYRRQGVATALWREARSTDDPPRHSPNRTKDGRAWIVAMRHRRTSTRDYRAPDVEYRKPEHWFD